MNVHALHDVPLDGGGGVCVESAERVLGYSNEDVGMVVTVVTDALNDAVTAMVSVVVVDLLTPHSLHFASRLVFRFEHMGHIQTSSKESFDRCDMSDKDDNFTMDLAPTDLLVV